MDEEQLVQTCKDVLAANDRKNHTVPAPGLYPHQWLWDSCFIAIGLRHYDLRRAQIELLSLTRGQWHNGMLPNIILNNGLGGRQSASFWSSNVSIYSPDRVQTSGITQPPVLAEAVVRIGEQLPKAERIHWYQRMYPTLLKYHLWLIQDRDPNGTGLVFQVHPWETGLDDTPPWLHEIHRHRMPLWIKTIKTLKIDSVISQFRFDRRFALPGQRMKTIDILSLYSLQRFLRHNNYDTKKIAKKTQLLIQDITFNSIFIRANQHILSIAKVIDQDVPKELTDRIRKGEVALEELFDPYTSQYYSRNAINGHLIKVASIGTLMPLYAGAISQERAKQLVNHLHNTKMFKAEYPVPTMPLSSSLYKEYMYWEGPTWVNTNWMIIDGLKRYGFHKEADHITKQTIEMAKKSGCYEYFSAKNASPAGVKNFSWTAALVIDLLKNRN
jgi:neutral trehalase